MKSNPHHLHIQTLIRNHLPELPAHAQIRLPQLQIKVTLRFHFLNTARHSTWILYCIYLVVQINLRNYEVNYLRDIYKSKMYYCDCRVKIRFFLS